MEILAVTLQSTLQNVISRGLASGKLLKALVGPWGLEPQTSTVSR